jgi:ribonuclease HI
MSKIKINSDSEYAINSCSGVYNGKCNIELINSIKASIKRYESYGFSISFHWVKGHSENKFNNKVDQLAYAAATEKKPNTEHS